MMHDVCSSKGSRLAYEEALSEKGRLYRVFRFDLGLEVWYFQPVLSAA